MKKQCPDSLPVGPPAKAPYSRPELAIFGSLAQLTSGPKSGTLDLVIGADGGFEPCDDSTFS